MNITTLKLDIFNGTETISPIYEVHTWERAEEIIRATKELIKDKPNATFSFEVYGNSTAYIA
jgi:hypothetical protein